MGWAFSEEPVEVCLVELLEPPSAAAQLVEVADRRVHLLAIVRDVDLVELTGIPRRG